MRQIVPEGEAVADEQHAQSGLVALGERELAGGNRGEGVPGQSHLDETGIERDPEHEGNGNRGQPKQKATRHDAVIGRTWRSLDVIPA